MSSSSFGKNGIKLKKEEDKLNHLINLGNKMVISKNFNIKNYLNFFEQLKTPKIKKPFNLLNSITTFNTKSNLINYNTDGYISSTNYKTSSVDKYFNKGKATFHNNINNLKKVNIMTSTFNESNNNKDLSFYNIPYTNSSSNFIIKTKFKTNYSPIKSDENFNVFKAVKEIKKSLQFPKINNTFNSKKKNIKTRNYYPKKSNNIPIAYKDKYLNTVLESTEVINNYNLRKELEFETDNDLTSFPKKTKDVSLKNVLIKLINHETVKLSEKEDDLKTKNEKNQKLLITEIKEFNDFTEKQKQFCKNLEVLHENLIKQNEYLNKEFINYKINNKSLTDETQKILEQIESLRNYALFVHQALEKDYSLYEKSIFPDYQNEKIDEYEKNIEKVKNFVLNNYRLFYDKQYKEQLKRELKFLNNIELLFFKFSQIEGDIMRLIEEQYNINAEIKAERKKDKENIKYLKERYDTSLIEYNINDEKLQIEKNFMTGLNEKENELNSEYLELIGELFYSIANNFGRFNKNSFNTKYLMKEKISKDNIDTYLKEGKRILRETEEALNNVLLSIKSYQENDTKFFNKFMDNTKKKLKDEQIAMFKRKKMVNLIGKNNQIINKANKVPFIKRKTASPYHSPKKKEKNVINYDLIKKLEDEELIKFQ